VGKYLQKRSIRRYLLALLHMVNPQSNTYKLKKDICTFARDLHKSPIYVKRDLERKTSFVKRNLQKDLWRRLLLYLIAFLY